MGLGGSRSEPRRRSSRSTLKISGARCGLIPELARVRRKRGPRGTLALYAGGKRSSSPCCAGARASPLSRQCDQQRYPLTRAAYRPYPCLYFRQFPSFLQLQKHARGCTRTAPFPRPPREKGQRPKRGRAKTSGTEIINTTAHMLIEPLPCLPEAAVLNTVRGNELLSLCASFRLHSADAVGKLAAILEPLEANLAHFADEVQDIAEEVVSVQEPANAAPSQGSRQRLDTIIDRAHDVAADLIPWRTQAGHAHQVSLTYK